MKETTQPTVLTENDLIQIIGSQTIRMHVLEKQNQLLIAENRRLAESLKQKQGKDNASSNVHSVLGAGVRK